MGSVAANVLSAKFSAVMTMLRLNYDVYSLQETLLYIVTLRNN